MKTQKDFFNNDKEERIVDLKRQIYDELLKPYRKACLRFVNLRHDSSFRSEEEDLQDILDHAIVIIRTLFFVFSKIVLQISGTLGNTMEGGDE